MTLKGEAEKTKAVINLQSQKSDFLKGAKKEWAKAKENMELYDQQLSNFRSEVKWLGPVGGFVMWAIGGQFPPDIDGAVNGTETKNVLKDIEDMKIEAALLEEEEEAGGTPGVGPQGQLVLKCAHEGQAVKDKSTNAFLKKFNSTQDFMRYTAQNLFDAEVKKEATKWATNEMTQFWGHFDGFVNGAIAALATLVGFVPFVGGALSAALTIILTYVYSAIKLAINTLFTGWIGEIIDDFSKAVLDSIFPSTAAPINAGMYKDLKQATKRETCEEERRQGKLSEGCRDVLRQALPNHLIQFNTSMTSRTKQNPTEILKKFLADKTEMMKESVQVRSANEISDDDIKKMAKEKAKEEGQKYKESAAKEDRVEVDAEQGIKKSYCDVTASGDC
jgi:hypothetical protein